MSELLPAWDDAAAVDRARALFTATFDGEPDGVWAAPGRVNLIGEHTDYNGGLCLPIALPHRTVVALRARTDGLVRLVSAQEDGLRELRLADVGPAGTPDAVEGWPAYVVGVAWALEREGLLDGGGFDVAVDSCVPYGAGLSSSAALECAVAVALDDVAAAGLAADDAGRARLAAACVRAENEVAGAPTGGMDQAAALRCAPGQALLLDCRDGATEQVPFDLAAVGLELLVIDTRAEHQLADGQYAARRTSCEDAARRLGVGTLREVTDLDAALAALDDAEQRRRVRHVVTEIARVEEFVATLRSGELRGDLLRAAAALVDASHTSLRDDYEVSAPELDVAVEAARAAGAHGARMTGGGFGGSAIALVDAGTAPAVAEAVRAAFAERGFTEPAFLLAVPSAPASRLA
ncbi:galactokinase [Georgenia faecalis]|uniref:galactokinase n=1 Tax=Georgenia faecalis TaxID=2483799 RepID=UPI0019D0CF01|nr:galactokinase [Georgenia faecalis]